MSINRLPLIICLLTVVALGIPTALALKTSPPRHLYRVEVRITDEGPCAVTEQHFKSVKQALIQAGILAVEYQATKAEASACQVVGGRW